MSDKKEALANLGLEIAAKLSKMIMACPSRELPAPEVERLTIAPALSMGALFYLSAGESDIAHHRNKLFGEVYRLIERHPEREYLALLDDDQLVTPQQWSWLCEVCDRARVGSARPIISAAYCVRQHPQRLAAKRIGGTDRPAVVIPASSGVGVIGDAPLDLSQLNALQDPCPLELPPVYCGLGAAVMHVSTFVHLANTATWLRELSRDGTPFEFPWLCWSGPLHGLDGKLHWAAEDTTFCETAWMRGCGVYLARHIRVGHLRVTREFLVPDDDTVLLCDDPERTDIEQLQAAAEKRDGTQTVRER